MPTNHKTTTPTGPIAEGLLGRSFLGLSDLYQLHLLQIMVPISLAILMLQLLWPTILTTIIRPLLVLLGLSIILLIQLMVQQQHQTQGPLDQ